MTEENAALCATIKAGAGYDAPWIVVRADNPQQLQERLNAVANTLTGPLVAAAQVLQGEWSGQSPQTNPGSQNFGGGNQGGNSGGFQNQGNGGYNGNQNQGGGGKTCAHGAMTYREGVSKTSHKPYKAYFCPNKDRNNQCKPEFVND